MDMKKLLLILPALMLALFVSGNDIKYSTVSSCAKEVLPETHQIQSRTNRPVMDCIMADTALQNRSLAVLLSARDSIFTVAIDQPKTPKRDTATVAEKPKVDSVIVKLALLRPFKSQVIWGGGRDRFGAFTEECAAHVNGRLSRLGVYSGGHSYMVPARFKPVINGYSELTLPNIQRLGWSEAFSAVLNTHRKAADYVKEHLDLMKLNPTKYYVVNMYYTTSKYMIQFYNEARWYKTNNYATHVGFVYFDKKTQNWVVEHNIHGNVHRDALQSVLGGRSNPRKYGVTTIYEVTKVTKSK